MDGISKYKPVLDHSVFKAQQVNGVKDRLSSVCRQKHNKAWLTWTWHHVLDFGIFV